MAKIGKKTIRLVVVLFVRRDKERNTEREEEEDRGKGRDIERNTES